MSKISEVKIDPPDKEVIEYIEDLLTRAKTGEIQSIAAVLSYPGRYVGSSWCGMNKNNMAIVGEIEVLKRDLMDLLISLRVDPETGFSE